MKGKRPKAAAVVDARSPMSESPRFSDPRLFDGVSRLFVAAAIAALAVSAQTWAVDRLARWEIVAPVQIAAVAGLSAMLGATKLPLLVRVALHLGALWILRETLGSERHGAAVCGLFIVSAAAFFGGLAVAGIASFGSKSPSGERGQKRSLTTGDLLAALFAFSAYVAVGQHEAPAFGPETLPVAELAVQHVLLPYAILLLAERLTGRGATAGVLCLAITVGSVIVFPHFTLFDPFAMVLVFAFAMVGRPSAAPTERPAASISGSLG
jgi:hypothetical protein